MTEYLHPTVPDIVAVRGTDGLVIDCKSGKQRGSDAFQVLTYMRVLPITHPACKGVTLAGEVQYRESSLPIEPDQLTDELKGILRRLIERLGSDTPAVKVPSASECRYCKITAVDCPDRIDKERRTEEVEHDIF